MKLSEWNFLSAGVAVAAIAPCCGSKQWATQMCEKRPYANENDLQTQASAIWNSLTEQDWLEAFASHPKIGERAVTGEKQHQEWASQEQAGAATAGQTTRQLLQQLNGEHEKKFGFIYILCATGKSADEMLSILQSRLNNSREQELKEAAKQQELITAIRLRKWLDS